MFYTYIGKNGSNHEYQVTLKLFMRCFSGRQFNNPAVISVFDRLTFARITNVTVPLFSQQNLTLPNTNPCISNPPLVCYDVGFYEFTVSLPENVNGYIISGQVNYRISGINNLITGYGQIGATYTAEIPGTMQVPSGLANNSAKFIGNDLVIVCANNAFTYSFAANDADGDGLRYSFCGAYQSSSSGQITPPFPPPYESVPYGQGYFENAPLGTSVTINPQTGLISGIAPPSGVYVVTVCVEEIRNGQVIAIQRKDLQISITECSIAAAVLENEYLLCQETTSISIANISSSPLITSHNWQVKDNNGNIIFTSADPVMNFNFTDTGIYQVKLLINSGQQCNDSATAVIRVYPGLQADFDVFGQCLTKPSQFNDLSQTPYGMVNSWKWFFGSATTTSTIKNPLHTYAVTGNKTVQLIVGTTKGCRDTIFKVISIFDKPPLHIPSKDTLICNGDTVQISAVGNGIFSWSPNINMLSGATSTASVFPSSTTSYLVTLNDNGCLNTDSIQVRVVDFVSLSMRADTVICLSDSISLGAQTNGLHFSWSPAFNLADPDQLFTRAQPAATTTYQLIASIGHCSTTGTYTVNTVPYPYVNAGADTTICYGTTGMLNGSSDAIQYSWSPALIPTNAQSLSTTARPLSTTSFVLTATDNKGCPKPSHDTMIMAVTPKIQAFAGNDTAVVINQPLQLNATGGVQYLWFPDHFLSLPTVADPIAVFNENLDAIRYTVYVFDDVGCVDSANIKVTVYKTPPIVFIPSAFTPNNDGKNDVLRPIAVGMVNIAYFRIFNRWGQQVFQTNINGKGWDGKINGLLQKTETYVWEVKATDFLGKPYFLKGVVTLIR